MALPTPHLSSRRMQPSDPSHSVTGASGKLRARLSRLSRLQPFRSRDCARGGGSGEGVLHRASGTRHGTILNAWAVRARQLSSSDARGIAWRGVGAKVAPGSSALSVGRRLERVCECEGPVRPPHRHAHLELVHAPAYRAVQIPSVVAHTRVQLTHRVALSDPARQITEGKADTRGRRAVFGRRGRRSRRNCTECCCARRCYGVCVVGRR
mmetsp:Transcript_30847/g.98524  ORF Transcript_30847/g.98524 Transcript_30847/m.98524 type:complete len:210 (+) Transcript_30847:373-1002(+)